MAAWPDACPAVSIVCATFNHEAYIEDALRGFLLQRTDFPFEIVIHDDASADNTRAIVQRYADAYPTLIKAVLQTVNQYSRGKKPVPLAAGHAKGRYVALCEGDDFWIDPGKLQRQFDEMRKHPACDISFHAAAVLQADETLAPVADYAKRVTVIPVDRLIAADGAFCPTASLMLKRSLFDRLPDWYYEKAPVGDYYLQVIGALSGGALYLPDAMSVYRPFTAGSWSASLYRKEKAGIVAHTERTLDCLAELDRFTDYRYSASIGRARSLQAFSAAILFLKKKHVRESWYFMKMSWSSCRRLFIGQLFSLSKKLARRTLFGR
ncbi:MULTISPECIES: glycosyltransferase [Methylomicrobium]|nr:MULTISPECIES: glycosyltransferase [Methylomicrobium]